MFERFTERSRQVLVLAQEEARTLRHSYIGTEHVLLGLLREEHGLAAQVLNSFNVTLEKTREAITAIVGSGGKADPSPQIPFTPRTKKVCELALREALSLGHNYIGTEHILLGLVRENEGVAMRVLLDFEADPEKVRGEVIRMLSGPAARKVKMTFTPAITLTLNREAVEWLWQTAAAMPHDHDASKQVYEIAGAALALADADRKAAA